MKIVISSITDSGILRGRSELIKELLDLGNQVIVVTPQVVDYKNLAKLGCETININIQAHGTNPITDLKLLNEYIKIYKQVKPDVVLTCTIKPNVYSGLACQRLRIPYIATINGIGDAIFNKGLLSKVSLTMLRAGLRKATCVFFQNTKNKQLLVEHGIVSEDKAIIVPGSGINVELNPYEEYPEVKEPVAMTFIGRISRDKGIRELLEASRIVKSKGYNFTVNIVGNCPDGFRKLINDAVKEGVINYLGKVEHAAIHGILANSHAVILPSYHEGIANVLLEGGAAGRPILATFAEGCEETFEDGITGIGFAPQSTDALIKALEKFLTMQNEERKKMGVAAHKKIVTEFDRKIVNAAYIDKIKLFERRKS